MTNQHVEEKRWAFRSDFNIKKKKKRGQRLMEFNDPVTPR